MSNQINSNTGIYGPGKMRPSKLLAKSDDIGFKDHIDPSATHRRIVLSTSGSFEVDDIDTTAVDIKTDKIKTPIKNTPVHQIAHPLSEDLRLHARKIDFITFKTGTSWTNKAHNLPSYQIYKQNRIREMLQTYAVNHFFSFDKDTLARQSNLRLKDIDALRDKGFLLDQSHDTSFRQKWESQIYALKAKLPFYRQNNLSLHYTTLDLPFSSPYRDGQPQSVIYTLKANNMNARSTSAQSVRVSFKPYGADAQGFTNTDQKLANFLGHKGSHTVLILPDPFNKTLDYEADKIHDTWVRRPRIHGFEHTPYRITEHFRFPKPDEKTANELSKIIEWAEKRFIKLGGTAGTFKTPFLRDWLNFGSKGINRVVMPVMVGATLIGAGLGVSNAYAADGNRIGARTRRAISDGVIDTADVAINPLPDFGYSADKMKKMAEKALA